MSGDACLICRQLSGEAVVPGGVLHLGEVGVFHVPPREGRPPYAGHLLVCSRRHARDMGGLSEPEAADVGRAVRNASRALTGLGAERVYLATIGHGVDHLHVHVLPRWPQTPPEVPWYAVDDWDGARVANEADVASVLDALRRTADSSQGTPDRVADEQAKQKPARRQHFR